MGAPRTRGSWKVFEIRIRSCLEMSGSLVPLVTGGHLSFLLEQRRPGLGAQSCCFLTTLLCAGRSECLVSSSVKWVCSFRLSWQGCLEDEIRDSMAF